MLNRLNKNNERLKTRKCNENDGCQIQLTTKRFEEDTVIACNVTNSVGHTGRNIHIKVRGKLSRSVNELCKMFQLRTYNFSLDYSTNNL